MSDPHLSIVIPCFDESRRLPPSLRTIRAWTGQQAYETEIVIVDDGSADDTAAAARTALADSRHQVLVHEGNRGKGAALRTGMVAALGRYVLFTDADLSTPIDTATEFLAAHDEGAPVVIGTRKTAGAQVTRHQPWLRERLGRVFTILSNNLICPGVSDFTCGFKSFRRDVARDIFSRVREEEWTFDSEVLLLAHRLGHEVREIPVRWENDPSTRVHMVRDVLRSLAGLRRIRARARRGEYGC